MAEWPSSKARCVAIRQLGLSPCRQIANCEQKRKFDANGEADGPDTSKPTARFKPIEGGREWTVSVAIPGSILDKCDLSASLPLNLSNGRSAITGEQHMVSPSRIGRALAVFNVDEVVIYDDTPKQSRAANVDPKSYTADVDHCHFLAHVLSYLETPPFMRKALFPLHPNLRYVGQSHSLDMPHHPHPNEWIPYREGVTIESGRKAPSGTLVDIGLKEPVQIEAKIPPKTRVTLKFEEGTRTKAEPIHPTAPRTEGGYYWGYSVRRAETLSAVFTESPYDNGYDASIGTSERGKSITRAFPPSKKLDFEHLLIVFGGPKGLEYASSNDEELVASSASGHRVKDLFDHWLNVLPGQGSRTIRTDEAVFIALSRLVGLWEDS